MTITVSVPKHLDAIGYLKDLQTEIDEPWFDMICDLVILNRVSQLNPQQIENLLALLVQRSNYKGSRRTEEFLTPVSTIDISSDRLETLSGFNNFKLLTSDLTVQFDKRITLLFGNNGSGKSSLCEALKILSQTERPYRTLKNVRNENTSPTKFRYKFRTDHSDKTWSIESGYGARRDAIHYFDTEIAIGNITKAVEPGRVVELKPFKLYIFEQAKLLLEQFRLAVEKQRNQVESKLNSLIDKINTHFKDFPDQPLANIAIDSSELISNQIKLAEEINDEDGLKVKKQELLVAEKAVSEEGLKLIKAEFNDLDTFLNEMDSLLNSTKGVMEIDPPNKTQVLFSKENEQQILAKALLPKRGKFDSFLSMVRAASSICEMDNPSGESCPLCKRRLGEDEVKLFQDYYIFLSNDLELEINRLKNALTQANEYFVDIQTFDLERWKNSPTFDRTIFELAHSHIENIISIPDISKTLPEDVSKSYKFLSQKLDDWRQLLDIKKEALEAVMLDKEKINQRIEILKSEIGALKYAFTVMANLDSLSELLQVCGESHVWESRLLSFPTLLRKITNKAKEAYEDLVIKDFETRLNDEFQVLTEKDMYSFGVSLARRGSDASVTVVPRIGETEISRVLSEGEQRIYSLALFFAEIESSSTPVIVFDDPICSFDYNFIHNYCIRMRDFALKYPERQIIVCTHCWEFFVQLQLTLNKACLNGELSLQVIENCASTFQYSEKIDDLKSSIEHILEKSAEPSRNEKESLAGNMRRLIESVVNTYVFNKERHQFKQKRQQISTFRKFTKVTPLLSIEATALEDLYGKLSITEHDDPRNAYINTDKAMFQTRYDKIQGIETAIKQRIPSF